jgi:hypothetical protein
MTGLFAATGDNSSNGFFDGVHDFFHSGTWYVIRNLLLFFVVVFWLSSVYWVYKDARRRIGDPWLVAMATILGILPFLGPLIYMLFRPPEYLQDVHERELEIRAMEDRLRTRDLHCPVCRAEVDPSYLTCPVCTTKLKQACSSCRAPLEALWQVCPYCETRVERGVPIDLGLADQGLDPVEAPLRTTPRRRKPAQPQQ